MSETRDPTTPAPHSGRALPVSPLLLSRILAEDDLSCHFDAAAVAACPPIDDSAILNRARDAIQWLLSLHLHNAPPSNTPFVLVLDQSKDTETAPSEADMQELLVFALTETMNAHVVIAPAPNGFFSDSADPRVTLLPPDQNLYAALEIATAVYTHSAGTGFDAILAGHRPRVFGQPWYAGYSLTADERPDVQRPHRLTRAQLFAAALIKATRYDHAGLEVQLEDILARLEARDRAAREDAPGYVASNILRWKRPFLRRYLGKGGISFTDAPARIASEIEAGRKHIAWGPEPDADLRLEDGFLRSRGLGAALVRPVSLVLDDLGLYFDPTRPSRLERHIAGRVQMPDHAQHRIERFLTRLTDLRLSKYNIGAHLPELPVGHRILVAGQVEDDASIRLGAGEVSTNLALLHAARAAHPEAVLIYKPHPDVEAGLRRGKIDNALEIADVVAQNADPLALIDACDKVWTMTSLIGFEALLRGKPVTCTGTPFYAGWGLTTDLGKTPARRAVQVSLYGLAHAALIDYPRYFDPNTGATLAPEEAFDLLATAPKGRSRIGQAAIAKLRQFRGRWLGLGD